MASLACAITGWEVTGHTIVRLIKCLFLMPAAISHGGPVSAVVAEGHYTLGEMAYLTFLGYGMAGAAILVKTEKITRVLEFIIDGMDPLFHLHLGMTYFAIGSLMADSAFLTGYRLGK